jgi:hypothetical protein
MFKPKPTYSFKSIEARRMGVLQSTAKSKGRKGSGSGMATFLAPLAANSFVGSVVFSTYSLSLDKFDNRRLGIFFHQLCGQDSTDVVHPSNQPTVPTTMPTTMSRNYDSNPMAVGGEAALADVLLAGCTAGIES